MDDDRRCRATSRRSGERCKRAATPDGHVCVMHGGASPNARKAAAARKAEREASALLESIWDTEAAPITDPVTELQALAGRLSHAANVLGARMEIDDLEGPTATAWARVLRELRQALEGMERLGLTSRQIELQQQQAELVTTAFLAALAAIPELLPGDRNTALRTFLAGLGRGSDTATVAGEVVAP